MADDKKARRGTEAVSGGNMAALSGKIIEKSIGVLKDAHEGAGRSSLRLPMRLPCGYDDFLHTAGFSHDRNMVSHDALSALFDVATIMKASLVRFILG